MTIVIACDGSCIQQGDFRKGDATDRPGAAGFVADVDGTLVGQAEPFANGTIGAMEVRALLMGLKFASALREQRTDLHRVPIEIVCDSRYAVQGYNDWLTGWAANGYNKKGGLANADDWRAIDELKATLGKAVQVTWTKGHSNGDTRHTQMNRRVDELVNGAARSQRSENDTHHVLGVRHPQNPPEEILQTPEIHVRAKRQAEALGRSDGMSVERQTQSSDGIMAQAASLLAKAADDPQLAGLLAQSLEMALDTRRLTARFPNSTLDAAQTLQAALEKRSLDR